VQWDSEGAFVWRVDDGRSKKVRVSIVQRNPDFILVTADLKDGDAIVTEGLQRVREGGPVRVADRVASGGELIQ
jgi:multidrug efflux pump subunit AcrA (membrane-fusion protein)